MGTQVNTYVIFGVILTYDALKDRYYDLEPYMDNAFNDKVNPKDNVTVLYDGMDGNYVAIGHVFAKTQNHRHFDTSFEVPTWMESDARVDVADVLYKLGLETTNECVNQTNKSRWHVISHYR